MFEIDKEKFGAFVAQLRKEKGLMQKDLAEKLYVSDKAVSKWERGLSIPDVAILVPLADILGVTVTELLECRRLSKDDPIDSNQAEDIVKKVIALSEEEQKRYRPDRRKRGIQLLVCTAIGCMEIWILTTLGYSMEALSGNLFVMMGLMAGFGLYFCVFARETLPQYYDDHRISSFSDGFLRMNIPGVSFNNHNWPHIVRAGQLWAMIGLVSAPILFFVVHTLLKSVWDIAGVFFILIFTLGGLFIPMYYAGRKYEFAPEYPRLAVIHRKDWIWIGSTILVIAVLLIVMTAGGGITTGSGVKVMWSEQKTRDSWSADYAYFNGYQQRTITTDDEESTLDVQIVTTDGSVGIVVTGDDGRIVYEQDSIPTSSFSIEIPGKVRVRIDANAHKGSFSLNWKMREIK